MAFQNHEGQVRSFQMPAYFWYRRAERSREEGQPVRALSLLRHAAQEEPDEREWRLEYAWQLTRLSCYEASNRECLDLLARWPAAFSAFGLLTLNMMALGCTSECMDAYSIYTQFIRLHPSATPAWDEDVYEVEDFMFSMKKETEHFHRLNTLLRIASKRMYKGDYRRAEKLLVRSRQAPFYMPVSRAGEPDRDLSVPHRPEERGAGSHPRRPAHQSPFIDRAAFHDDYAVSTERSRLETGAAVGGAARPDPLAGGCGMQSGRAVSLRIYCRWNAAPHPEGTAHPPLLRL